ncbi:unnamed protein product, partial [Didymodactylos carnosus]
MDKTGDLGSSSLINNENPNYGSIRHNGQEKLSSLY